MKHNCDIAKDLGERDLVAVNSTDWPWVNAVPPIGRVLSVVPARDKATVAWLDLERASKKPIWKRGLKKSKRPPSCIDIADIVLYQFELNPKGQTLRKATREELQRIFSSL